MHHIHGDLQEMISVESMHGSDDKARIAVSAEIILHGWVDIINLTLFNGIQDKYPHGHWLEFFMSGLEAVYIQWDAPTNHTSGTWYFLTVVRDRNNFRGLVLQRVATGDFIPTFSRSGCYWSYDCDPVLGILPEDHLEKGEDWDAKLLLAPLIRLV